MSFNPVVGACCLVTFTNGLYNKKSPGDLTLNINSTGAKEFWFKVGGMHETSQRVGLDARATSLKYNGAPYMGLWLFDGSIYVYQGVDYYNDYPDTD